MIILVDIDGVLAPIHIEWIRQINYTFDDNLVEDDIDSWDAIMNKSKGGAKVFDLLPFVYENTMPMLGASWGVKHLRDKGHKVVFVTSGIFLQKIEWMFKWGFSISKSKSTPSDIIIASDKSLVIGHVLIDDYHKNLYDRDFPILFDARWNRDTVGFPRALDWKQAVRMVDTISNTKGETYG